MFGSLSRLKGSRFIRSVATLAAGQGIASLIPIATAPILGRLYHPADYGALATYMAFATLFGAAAALQMQNAVIAAPRQRTALTVVSACVVISIAIGLLSVVAAFAIYVEHRDDAEWRGLYGWLLLLPATTVAAGSTAGINALANRLSRYGFLARVQVASVAASTALSIALGFAGAGAQGLFAAYFLQQATMFAAHVAFLTTVRDFKFETRLRRLLATLRPYRRFAFFTLPAEFVSSFNQSLPVFTLSAAGNISALGSFNRARQLVMLPFNLLGSSIAQVFRQSAAAQYNATGSCRRLYAKTFLTLLIAGMPPVAVLLVFAPDLFRIFLGPNWTEAGEMARILAPMLLIRLIASPLSSVFYFAHAQAADLALMVGGLVVTGAALWVGLKAGWDSHLLIGVYAAGYSVLYLAYLAGGWVLAKRRSI